MNTHSRLALLATAVAISLSWAAVPANAAPPPAAKSASSATQGPPGKAKPDSAVVPPVRQSPYARAVHENAAAENAALAQMQASGQPVPFHTARPSGQLAPAGKGGRGHGSHR